MSAGDEIEAVLVDAGIAKDLRQRLAAYGELVLTFNRTTNVTAAREPSRFAEQILDSLTLSGDIDGELIDLGAGGGLPGIPLAIATGMQVVLVESNKKKAQFLAGALDTLGISGEALSVRAEHLARSAGYRERFACGTARAVASAPTVAELVAPFLMLGGRALLQRGTLDERERQAVSDAAPILGCELIEERLLTGERRVVVLIKRSPTQPRFPRREGIPEKRPLCYS